MGVAVNVTLPLAQAVADVGLMVTDGRTFGMVATVKALEVSF